MMLNRIVLDQNDLDELKETECDGYGDGEGSGYGLCDGYGDEDGVNPACGDGNSNGSGYG